MAPYGRGVALRGAGRIITALSSYFLHFFFKTCLTLNNPVSL